MIPVQNLADADANRLLNRVQLVDPDIEVAVQGIFHLLQQGGEPSLLEITKRFDGVALSTPFLATEKWVELAAACPADVRAAIDGNLARIKAFHERQVGGEDVFDVVPGVRLGRRPIPFDVVGCYVPGGRASYPSSALMTVCPAALAGVKRIIVATPPRRDGTIDPAVAYAAHAAGATDILLAGGAQAVAALAIGTANIPKVQAIVGPGNAYVTAAKRRVEGIHTDAPAGPSELLVLADASADPDRIAWDLMAQAEHDPEAQVLLVSTSKEVAEAVAATLERLVPAADRRIVIEASLKEHGALLVAPDLDAAVTFCNEYAAEHVEIHTDDAIAVMRRIRNAGSIFVGGETPVSLGDYGSGTNHVLPTMGFAALRGGLCVDDFRKWITWQSSTHDGLAEIAADITTLARAEGLICHAQAVERRLQ